MTKMEKLQKVCFLCFGFIFLVGCDGESNKEELDTLFSRNVHQTYEWLCQMMYSVDENVSSLKHDVGRERFKIVHISDIHIANWTDDNRSGNPQNLLEAVHFSNIPEMNIDAMVATGDFVSQTVEMDKSVVIVFLESFASAFYGENLIPSFFCTGNHDDNLLSDNLSFLISKQELHSVLSKRLNYPCYQPSGENYYYADLNDHQGGMIRVIALDNTDLDGFEYPFSGCSRITRKQVEWLINIALKENMTSGHGVIILNHHPLQPFSRNQETYMCAGTHLYSEKLVPDIINAFIKKETLDRTYKTVVNSKYPIHVRADFSNIPGEFICYLGGHAHTFGNFEVLCNDSLQAKQVMLLGNTLSPGFQNNNYCYTKREKQSEISNSFSIYAIDREEKNIYRTFFGARPTDVPAVELIPYR